MAGMIVLLMVVSCAEDEVTPSDPPPSSALLDTAPPDTAPPDSGEDEDSDGYTTASDCDDTDASSYPGAPERCDGRDNDCDGVPLEDEVDDDADGVLDCAACEAAGFWLSTRTVTDADALRAVLDELLPATACKDYSAAREHLFLVLDNNEGDVEGFYTGEMFSVGEKLPDWDVVNTEHLWPRSAGAEIEPAECDLHHLVPTAASVNNLRSSYPFGEVVDASWSEGGSAKGISDSGEEVFEPRDVRKGDTARAMLYFATRYRSIADLDAQLGDARLAMFQRWHQEDPPDEAEQNRSLRIADEQGAANPFVVCPRLVDVL